MGLEWDKDGEMLAVIQAGSPIVKLWDANQVRRHTTILLYYLLL